MRFKAKKIIPMLFLLILVGCSNYGKIYKGKNTELKYNKANELYEKKDFNRATPLLEQLRDAYKNKPDSLEMVYVKTAYCYFYMKDYDYASMFFKDFTDNFPRSKQMKECAYMALYCDVLFVGESDLDQSKTTDVLNALQTFINYYPESEYVTKCNEHIDALRGKLHTKAIDQVMQYYAMQEFKAASAAAQIAIKNYPDIPKKEELEYISYQAQFLYAMNSVESKRLERLEKAQSLLEDYYYVNQNSGEHADDAAIVKQKIKKEITKLKEIL